MNLDILFIVLVVMVLHYAIGVNFQRACGMLLGMGMTMFIGTSNDRYGRLVKEAAVNISMMLLIQTIVLFYLVLMYKVQGLLWMIPFLYFGFVLVLICAGELYFGNNVLADRKAKFSNTGFRINMVLGIMTLLLLFPALGGL